MIFLLAAALFFVGLIVRLVHDNGVVWADSWLWLFSGSTLVAVGLFLYHGWPTMRRRVVE